VEEHSAEYMPPDGFFGIQICKIQFQSGLCHPSEGTYEAPPWPHGIVGWGGDMPFNALYPIPHPFNTFSISLFMPKAQCLRAHTS